MGVRDNAIDCVPRQSIGGSVNPHRQLLGPQGTRQRIKQAARLGNGLSRDKIVRTFISQSSFENAVLGEH